MKGASGDLGVAPWPNDSCHGCWDEDLREGTRAPCSAHPMLVRVFVGGLTSYQPGILLLQASRANWACFPLWSLPYLWALPTCWLNLPTRDGQGTTHRLTEEVWSYLWSQTVKERKDSSSRSDWVDSCVCPHIPWLLPPHTSAPYTVGCFQIVSNIFSLNKTLKHSSDWYNMCLSSVKIQMHWIFF